MERKKMIERKKNWSSKRIAEGEVGVISASGNRGVEKKALHKEHVNGRRNDHSYGNPSKKIATHIRLG